jgi:hypothetical protein
VIILGGDASQLYPAGPKDLHPADKPGIPKAFGPLYTRIPKFDVTSLSKSVLKSVSTQFNVGYCVPMTSAISQMKLEKTGTGALRAGGISFPVKYAVEGSSLYLCPAERCCQHWNLKKVATNRYAMKLVEQDDPELCKNVRGLIPNRANKLYVPKCNDRRPRPIECKSTLFRTFPVVWRLLYSKRPGDFVSQLKFNKDFTGSLTQVIGPFSNNQNFTWKSVGKVLSLTSGKDSKCTQLWTFYFNRKTHRYHIKLTKKAAKNCADATGLLHSLQDIGLEIQESNDIAKQGAVTH